MKNLKEIWRQFTEAMKGRGKMFVVAATSAFLLNSMTSCTSAADKYQSWEIQLEIKQEKAKLKTEIEAYNQYFDIYENFKRDMVALQAKGDVWGYQNVYNKSEELKATIEKVEKEIDERADELLELQKELNKGKEEFGVDQIQNQNVPTSWNLKRRSFVEYKRFIK